MKIKQIQYVASILIFATAFAFLSFTTTSFAQESDNNLDLTFSQLKQYIAELESQIAALQVQLNAAKKIEVQINEITEFTQTLQAGMTGDGVKKLQEFLKQFPDIYPEGLVTGYFGQLTEAAIKRFQDKQGIEVVGIVGPKTRAKLNELATSSAITPSETIPVASAIPSTLATPAISDTSAIPAVPSSGNNGGGGGGGGGNSATHSEPATPATPAISAESTPGTGTPAVPATPANPAMPANTMPSWTWDYLYSQYSFAEYQLRFVYFLYTYDPTPAVLDSCNGTVSPTLAQYLSIKFFLFEKVKNSEPFDSCYQQTLDEVLKNESKYNYAYKDAFANTSTLNQMLNMGSTTLNMLPPADPPTILNIETSNITDSSATISLTISEPINALLRYGPTASYGSYSEDNVPSTSHSFTLVGLRQATTYHFIVDLQWWGRWSIVLSPDQAFTTLPASSVMDNFEAYPNSGIGWTGPWTKLFGPDKAIQNQPTNCQSGSCIKMDGLNDIAIYRQFSGRVNSSGSFYIKTGEGEGGWGGAGPQFIVFCKGDGLKCDDGVSSTNMFSIEIGSGGRSRFFGQELDPMTQGITQTWARFDFEFGGNGGVCSTKQVRVRLPAPNNWSSCFNMASSDPVTTILFRLNPDTDGNFSALWIDEVSIDPSEPKTIPAGLVNDSSSVLETTQEPAPDTVTITEPVPEVVIELTPESIPEPNPEPESTALVPVTE